MVMWAGTAGNADVGREGDLMVMWAGTAGKLVFIRPETCPAQLAADCGWVCLCCCVRVTRRRSCVWFSRSPVFRCAAAWSGDVR